MKHQSKHFPSINAGGLATSIRSLKKYLIPVFLSAALFEDSAAQTFQQKYFKNGTYIFDDLQKIMQTQIFTIHKAEFGLGINDVMVQTNNVVSQDGKFNTKYVLHHKGIPVEGSMMNVIGEKGVVQYANGFLLTGLNVNVNNIISEQQAIQNAIASVNSSQFIWQDAVMEAGIKEEYDDPNATHYPNNIRLEIVKKRGENFPHTAANYQLCYVVPIISLNPVFHKAIYVNANNGSIFTSSDAAVEDYSTMGSVSTAHDGSHSDMITSTCTFCTNYRLYDSGKNLKTGSFLTSQTLSDGNNNWVESSTKTGASAHWAMQKVWSYYRDRHGRSGSNYHGQHVKIFTEKPMTSGTNSYLNPTITTEDWIYIRPNTSSGHSAAMLDVIGHEYTHAMIRQSSNLGAVATDYEARSMAEGYSDIFGMRIEGYVHGTYDWTFAENMGSYQRNFQYPHSDFPTSSPEIYLEPSYWNPYAIHLNGGVLRKWFYLLSNGGTFNGNTVLPLGIETATDIAYITFNWWLWSNLKYPEMASQTVHATVAHWGKCSKEHKQVIKALRAVGFNIPNPLCVRIGIDGPVILQPQSNGGAVKWKAKLNDIQDANGTYQWNIPQGWNASAQGDELILNSHMNTNSQKLSVTYTATDGSKSYDTIVVHFSNEQWQPTNNVPAQTMSATVEEQLNAAKGFTLSPNPASQKVQVTLLNFENNAQVELYDINGRLINSYDCQQAQLEINVSGLSSGLYILRAKMNGQSYTQKLSVAH